MRSRLQQEVQTMAADNQLPMHTITFSMIDGNIWASWPGKNSSVELGRYDDITYMMRDFLAQCELGERMALGKRVLG
jgi:hypothetical protein